MLRNSSFLNHVVHRRLPLVSNFRSTTSCSWLWMCARHQSSTSSPPRSFDEFFKYPMKHLIMNKFPPDPSYNCIENWTVRDYITTRVEDIFPLGREVFDLLFTTVTNIVKESTTNGKSSPLISGHVHRNTDVQPYGLRSR